MEKYLTVKDIVNCTNGKLIIGDENIVCKSFQRDSRLIKKDDVFLAMKGEHFNGNLFWKTAFENGAKVAIVTELNEKNEELEKYKDKAIIKVEDQIIALQQIATKKRELYGKTFPVIAVTGSVGKTSTKDALAGVLSKKYKVLKTQVNYNNDIGVPLTILSMQDEDVAVVEMGMNHLGEISRLSKIVKPNIAIITNIGTSHIGNLGSRENILKAKLEIIEGMEVPYLILNNDNDLLHNWYEENKNRIKIKTFGIKNDADCLASEVSLHELSSSFICNIENEKFEVNVNVPGEHYVLNSLCAALVGKILKMTNEEIKDGIENIEFTKKRMEILKLNNNITLINDSYNASYESMQASIKYLSSMEHGRKITVLGDMLELGEFSEELHRKVGVEVAKNNIDILLCAGENSKYIFEEAKNNGMEEAYFAETKEELYNMLMKILKQNDYILIKASNGMKFYELAEWLKND